MATWTIATLEHNVADGGVTVAHWRVTEVDGDYSASAYGTCGFSPDASSPDFTPYDQLTQDQVLGWCWADGLDKDAVELSLTNNINDQKNPTTADGVPW
jgi:hypothetical protein